MEVPLASIKEKPPKQQRPKIKTQENFIKCLVIGTLTNNKNNID
jgi:hypothetical protein